MQFPEFAIAGYTFASRLLYTFSVTFALAIIAVFLIGIYEAKKRGLSRKEFTYLYLALFAGLLVGGRIYHVLFWHPGKTLLEKFLYGINPFNAGLASFGEFIGIFLAAYIFYKVRKIDIWKYLDTIGVGAGLGVAISRIGCFFAGCCYGSKADEGLLWGIYYHNAVRHPAQLYDLLNGLLIFLFIFFYLRKKEHFPGFLFLFATGAYAFFRGAVVESFRGDSYVHLLGMTNNQISYLALSALIFAVMFWRWKKGRHKPGQLNKQNLRHSGKSVDREDKKKDEKDDEKTYAKKAGKKHGKKDDA